MEVKRLLKELGLSNYEAEAYLKVVEVGVAEQARYARRQKYLLAECIRY